MTTRRWMVVVAGLALAFAGWNEWYYRTRRDLCERGRARYARGSERHEQLRRFCLEHAARQGPYDRIGRRDALDHDPDVLYPSLAPEFVGWDDEARDHASWAALGAQTAAQLAASKREAERHLIFP